MLTLLQVAPAAPANICSVCDTIVEEQQVEVRGQSLLQSRGTEMAWMGKRHSAAPVGPDSANAKEGKTESFKKSVVDAPAETAEAEGAKATQLTEADASAEAGEAVTRADVPVEAFKEEEVNSERIPVIDTPAGGLKQETFPQSEVKTEKAKIEGVKSESLTVVDAPAQAAEAEVVDSPAEGVEKVETVPKSEVIRKERKAISEKDAIERIQALTEKVRELTNMANTFHVAPKETSKDIFAEATMDAVNAKVDRLEGIVNDIQLSRERKLESAGLTEHVRNWLDTVTAKVNNFNQTLSQEPTTDTAKRADDAVDVLLAELEGLDKAMVKMQENVSREEVGSPPAGLLSPEAEMDAALEALATAKVAHFAHPD